MQSAGQSLQLAAESAPCTVPRSPQFLAFRLTEVKGNCEELTVSLQTVQVSALRLRYPCLRADCERRTLHADAAP
jgi:hypothetical protein